MAGSIRSNNSGYGGVDVTANDIVTFTWGGWFKAYSDSYDNGPVYQYVCWLSSWAYGQEVALETDTNTLFFDRGPQEYGIGTSGNTQWWYIFWTKSGTSVTVKIRAQGTSTWTTLATFTVTDTEVEYIAVLQSKWPFGVGIYNAGVRSWRLWDIVRSDSDMSSESDSRIPLNTTNLKLAVADGETPNAAAANWNGATYGTITLGTSGTVVYVADDPITGGGGDQSVSAGLLAGTIATPTLAPGGITTAPGVLVGTTPTPSLVSNVTLLPGALSTSILGPLLLPGAVTRTPGVLLTTQATPTLVPGNRNVAAGVLAATLLGPTLAAGNVNLTPSTLAGALLAPVLLTGGVVVAAGSLGATLAGPSLVTNVVLSPSLFVTTIAAPTVQSNFTTQPAAQNASIATPSLGSAAAVTPSALTNTAPVPSLTAGGVNVAPGSLAATTASPSLNAGGASVTPGVQQGSIATPALATTATVTPAVVSAPALPVPSVFGAFVVTPAVLVSLVAAPSIAATATLLASQLVAAAPSSPTLAAAFTLFPAALAAIAATPVIEGQATINPATMSAAVATPGFVFGGVSTTPGNLSAAAFAPSLLSGGLSLLPGSLSASAAAPTIATGAVAIVPALQQVAGPAVPSLTAGGSTVVVPHLAALSSTPLVTPGDVSVLLGLLSSPPVPSPSLAVGSAFVTPGVTAAEVLQADVVHGGEVAQPGVLQGAVPAPVLQPGAVGITAGILRAVLQQPTLSNYYDDLPIPEDVNPQGVSLTVEGMKVRSLDVDFNEVSWRLADTLEDVFDFSLQVLRSEGPEGPYRPISPEFQDRYVFIDNDVKHAHRDRTYYYKICVKKLSSGATRLFGPVYKAPEVDLVAEELRKHIILLTREFIGRSCWVYPVRTFGGRCRECYNPHLQAKTKSHCLSCYDTGFVGGYLQPIETWISIDPTTKATQQTNVGTMQLRSTTARLPWWPPLKEGDLVVEPENLRWRVTAVNTTEQVRAVVHQEVSLHCVQSSDMEYRIPLKLEGALRDLWLSPARNMSNPHDLSSYGNEDYADVLQLYGTAYPKIR